MCTGIVIDADIESNANESGNDSNATVRGIESDLPAIELSDSEEPSDDEADAVFSPDVEKRADDDYSEEDRDSDGH